MTRSPLRRLPAARFRLERLEPRDVPATFTWDGGGLTADWSEGANWVGDVAPTGAAGEDLVFPSGALRAASTNDLATATFNSITFTGSGYTLGGNPLALVAGAGAVRVVDAAATISLDLVLGAAAGTDQEFAVGGAAAKLEVAGAIAGATGSGLLKTGPGALTFGGSTSNTYAGPTAVADGFLYLNKTGGAVAIPAAGLAVTGPAFAQYQQGDQLADDAPVFVSSPFGLDLNGFDDAIGPLTLGEEPGATLGGLVQTGPPANPGTLTLTGDVTRLPSTLNLPARISGKINLVGTRTFTVPADGTPAVELDIPAEIVGPGGLTKAGAGDLLLFGTSPNSYAGTTTVTGGRLSLNRPDAVSVPGALVIGNGTDPASVVEFAANQVADAAPVTVHAGATFGLNSVADTVGPVTVAGGTVNVGAGAGRLTVGGELTLTGASVTGGTNARVVLTAGVTTLAAAAATTIAAPLDLNGATRTFTVADGGAADDLFVTGVVRNAAGGTPGLTKAGPGRLVLAGTNTYTGTTTVTAGTLRVVGSQPNSPVSLAGGTLGGGGSVGPVTATGGTVTPGLVDPPVALAAAGLTLGAGSTYAPFVTDSQGGVSDLLNVPGAVNLNGATLAPILVGAAPTGNQLFLLIANGGTDPVSGTFAGLPQGATVTVRGVAFTIRYDGNDGNDVVLVPNPTSPPPPPLVPGGPGPLPVGGATDGTVRAYLPGPGGLYGPAPAAVLAPFGAISANVRATTGDVDGDQVADVIMVTGPRTAIRLAVVSGADGTTVLVAPFDPFGGNFTGGGFVTAADFDRDGRAEVVVTPDRGGGPRVVIFSLDPGGAFTRKASYLGIDDPGFRGGARAGAGDVDRDGTPDLVVAAGFGGGPRVSLFDGDTVLSTRAKLVGDFFAFDPVLRNGAYVAVGDVDGDGFGDLAFGAGPGGAPRLLTVSGQQLLTAGSVAAIASPLSNFFVAGNATDRGGVRVATTDADGDARADVVVGTGENAVSRVRVYLGKNFGGAEPAVFQDLDPYGSVVLADGVFVG